VGRMNQDESLSSWFNILFQSRFRRNADIYCLSFLCFLLKQLKQDKMEDVEISVVRSRSRKNKFAEKSCFTCFRQKGISVIKDLILFRPCFNPVSHPVSAHSERNGIADTPIAPCRLAHTLCPPRPGGRVHGRALRARLPLADRACACRGGHRPVEEGPDQKFTVRYEVNFKGQVCHALLFTVQGRQIRIDDRVFVVGDQTALEETLGKTIVEAIKREASRR
jgi:hypothetical protein